MDRGQASRKLTPAFTDVQALRNFDPNTPWLSPPARSFFEMVSKHFPEIQGVIINPFDPIRKMMSPMGVITRSELEVLARGQVPVTEEAGLCEVWLPTTGLEACIQPPRQALPTRAAEIICESAASFHEIAALYVFSVAHPHASPQLTVGVKLDRNVTRAHEQDIVRILWDAVAPNLIQTELKSLDFVVLDSNIDAPVERVGTKIYQRS